MIDPDVQAVVEIVRQAPGLVVVNLERNTYKLTLEREENCSPGMWKFICYHMARYSLCPCVDRVQIAKEYLSITFNLTSAYLDTIEALYS